MTNEEAIIELRDLISDDRTDKENEALLMAIEAVRRDAKVDNITFQWNVNKSNFVAACIAFEEILKVYGRGVEELRGDNYGS